MPVRAPKCPRPETSYRTQQHRRGNTGMAIDLDIHKTLDRFRLDIHLHSKEKTLCLLGPSGSGKTMTLSCIAGLETPDEGYIHVDDAVYYHSEQRVNLPPRQRRVGYVFQNYALFPHMTVLQNVTYGLRRLPRREREEKGLHYLGITRLTELKDKYPAQLSGGQQQRVALARSLILEPDVLLMDEPFSALDYNLKKQLESELLSILAHYEGQTLFVTHNLEEAYSVCESIAVYSAGHIVAIDKKENIFTHAPRLQSAVNEKYRSLAEILQG